MRSSACKHPLLVIFSAIVSTVVANEPQALSVTFGPDYLGYDGLWSAAQIRVGTPEQYLSLFPSTTSSETWVAGPDFCDGTTTCASLRGGLYYTENSSTWQPVGEYELGYTALSNTVDQGNYGFDNISISDTIVTSNQIVAVVDDYLHWNGQFGLSVQDTRFSNTTNHLPFLSTLVQNDSVIPSHSYGYTAGASYQGRGVLGSLTLGGVDTSRYTSSNFWFTLGSEYIPSVVIKSIEVAASTMPMGWAANPQQLMAQNAAAIFVIDSSTPYLWLPQSICDNVATALNLTWNPSIELYVFDNSSSPEDLVDFDLQFTFNLANDVSSAEMIALKVSYGAFNLQLSYPFPGLFDQYSDAKINYFPLRRANGTQQYTIGRAFLQEIYLVVDYERNAFQLSQALFPDSSQQPVLAGIKRPEGSTWPGPGGTKSSSGLSTGAKVGIAIGLIFAAAAVTALIWFFCLKRRRHTMSLEDEKSQKTGLLSIFSRRSTRKSSASISAAELGADRHQPTEMISDSSNSRFELSALAPAEMAAGEVAPGFFQERNNARISQRNDPRSPVELTQTQTHESIGKDGTRKEVRERTSSPAPEYSPAATDQRHSHDTNGVSSYSQRHSGNPFQNNSDNGISPVTGTNSDRNRSSHMRHSRTGSDSSRFLSPVSPVQGRHDGQNSSYSSTKSSSNNGVSSESREGTRMSLSPIPDASTSLRRSTSRNSRFKEELTEQNEPTQPQHQEFQGMTQNNEGTSRGQSRFSWEA